ncbi:MAG: hypothetical protein IPG76_14725 [Acidobacteria bacterium]|nr:hypothetical protein [Acidobacteriota bacterium]
MGSRASQHKPAQNELTIITAASYVSATLAGRENCHGLWEQSVAHHQFRDDIAVAVTEKKTRLSRLKPYLVHDFQLVPHKHIGKVAQTVSLRAANNAHLPLTRSIIRIAVAVIIPSDYAAQTGRVALLFQLYHPVQLTIRPLISPSLFEMVKGYGINRIVKSASVQITLRIRSYLISSVTP